MDFNCNFNPYLRGFKILPDKPPKLLLLKYNCILQIDDDADDCEMFAEALHKVSESEYISINNPVKALENLIAGLLKPDVIVLDVNMPGMNGIEVLSKIMKNKNTSGIPVIMFSTSAHQDHIDKSMALGALKYVAKPFSIGELRAFIQSEL